MAGTRLPVQHRKQPVHTAIVDEHVGTSPASSSGQVPSSSSVVLCTALLLNSTQPPTYLMDLLNRTLQCAFKISLSGVSLTQAVDCP